MQELKALKILKDIKINKDGLGLELHPNCTNDDIEIAIEELEQYEQKFKDKEFKYRTQCQNILSTERVVSDKVDENYIPLTEYSSAFKVAGYESDGRE